MDRNTQILEQRKRQKTLEEIGDFFGISPERVRQVLKGIPEYQCANDGSKEKLAFIGGQWLCNNCREKVKVTQGFFSSVTAATLLGIDRETLKRMARKGLVRYQISLNSHWMFPKTEIYRLLAEKNK